MFGNYSDADVSSGAKLNSRQIQSTSLGSTLFSAIAVIAHVLDRFWVSVTGVGYSTLFVGGVVTWIVTSVIL